jgi:hypothetical protein
VPKKRRQVIVSTWIIVSRAGSAAHISAGADRVALPRVLASCLLGTSGFILFGLGGKMASFGNLFRFRSLGGAIGFRTGLRTFEESSPAAAPGHRRSRAESIRGRDLISPIHTIHRDLGSPKAKLFIINEK